MHNKSKYTYLAKNTILFTISSFGSKILSFLLVPLYTAVLSTEDYGTADMVTTTASLLVFIFTINIGDAVLRFAIERSENQEEILNFGLKVLFAGSAILATGIFVFRCFDLIQWADYCYLFLFLAFFCTALNGIFSNYLRAIDKVAAVAISGIILTATVIGCNLLYLLVFRWGIVGYMLATILGNSACIVYALIVLRKQLPTLIKAHISKETKMAMCRYSIPLIFNGIAWWMNASIDKYFLTAICGFGINGIFAVAQKIPSILSMFSTIFAQAWNLSAIKEFDSKDSDGFFSNTYKLYNAGLVIICSALIIINVPVARLLFAKDFFQAWEFSSPLLISMVFSSMSSFVGSIFAAVKKSNIFAISTVAAAFVNIVLNALLIPPYGGLGAAIATASSFFVVWLIRLVCARRFIKLRINLHIDCIAYLLLIMQIVFEHLEGHCYAGQVVIFVVLILLYRKTFLKIVEMMLKKAKIILHIK